MTPFEKAQQKFPVGSKVNVPANNPPWGDYPQCDKVVCGHLRFRDSEDDPIICVCLVSTTGAQAGWFYPKELKKVK